MENKIKSIPAWKNKTSKGDVINFTINGQKWSMWENKHKKEDKHPDYNIIENNYQPSGAANNAMPVQKIVEHVEEPEIIGNDDLPF